MHEHFIKNSNNRSLYTEFMKPVASLESRHGQDKRILQIFLLSCPVLKCLDSMLAPGFKNLVYISVELSFLTSAITMSNKTV